MKKKNPDTLAILAYLKSNPKATPLETANKLKLPLAKVYAARYAHMKKPAKALKKGRPAAAPVQEPIVLKLETTNGDKALEGILGERGNRYGTFENNAKTCQLLKNVFHAQEGWYRLSYVQREAVEMMMHKISRLINGDSTYTDTVVDIAGYNQLMLNHMNENNHGQKMEK